MAGPPLYVRLIPIDLGPRERLVGGEVHLTLTGWDRGDYSVLTRKPDAVILQMANPDVTDATLSYVKGMSRLRELDLNGTKITDLGLSALQGLPALETLRLRDTGVTDAGFRDVLATSETLKQLDLRGTKVSRQDGPGVERRETGTQGDAMSLQLVEDKAGDIASADLPVGRVRTRLLPAARRGPAFGRSSGSMPG